MSLSDDRRGSFPPGGAAIVIGATGGIGGALLAQLSDDPRFARAVGLSRAGAPALDLDTEASIIAAAGAIAALGLELRLVVDATGLLHGDGCAPEKSWRAIDPAQMARSFAINAIGPALLMKHFLPLLAPGGKAAFATLSAKVGSIGDNQLGGWYSYRAAKAALNQLVRTAAIELRRRRPEALCVALHPGTVATALSAPFAKPGPAARSPAAAAADLIGVIDSLGAAESGGFFDYRGAPLPW